MYEVRNLAFSFKQKRVLKDVSFMVSPGEIVTILGANGAGKTTLLRVLSTLLVPDAGLVLSDGQDLLARPEKYRHLLGYLPEKVALYEDMTIKEYLHYRAELKGELAKRIRRRVSEAVDICRLSEVILRTNIRSLSLGMKKRVALADALLLRPRVLLLDDFLAGLDFSMREASGEILANAAAFSSVIVTGHEIDDFAKWTTRFLVLGNGVISASVDATGATLEDLRSKLAPELMGGRL